MATEQKHRSIEDIREKAVQDFLKDSQGLQVDLSGLPSIKMRFEKKNESGDDFRDERFSMPPDDQPFKLRREIPRFVNLHAADPEVARVLRAGGVKDNSADGQAGTVYVRVRESGEEVPVDVAFKNGFWVASAGGKKYSAESRDGLLDAVVRGLNQATTRGLTDAELREISILAQGVGFYPAVSKYVSLVSGLPQDAVLSDEALLDSRNARVYDQAVHAVWLALNTQFSPDDTWPEFLAAYRGSRHLSAALLDGARCAFETQKETMARESILSQVDQPEEPPAPTYKELDELGDEELADQLRSVSKEHARLVRAGIV